MEKPIKKSKNFKLSIDFKSKSFKTRVFIYSFSLIIRLLLVAYSSFHNMNFDVQYTDVDYLVFTDAAKHVISRQSPYKRHTYRYTPLLSYLMVFNHHLFNDFGKLIFSVSDLIVGFLIDRSLSYSSDVEKAVLSSFWLLNPFVIIISTRGNADTLICLLTVLTLFLLSKRQIVLSAIVFGLSIHFKLYPIIYFLPFVFYLYSSDALSMMKDTYRKDWKFLYEVPFILLRKINLNHLKFIFFTALSFSLFTYLTYFLYGFEGIFESYIYHYLRKDHRHNFSLYFNLMYYIVDTNLSLNLIMSFLPQFFCLLTFSVLSFFDLTLSLFLMTISFVVLNKVLTSQHFLWWIALLPLVLGNIDLKSKNLKYIFLSTCFLFIFKFLWLLSGYMQEFQGFNSFLEMLLCSTLLVISHMLLAWSLLYQSYKNKKKV